MAQQTQIARAEQYWRAWMVRFPTIEVLAAATPADVLRAWQGLGYDRRALNLLRCARVIVASHGGRLPTAVADLERLPGLGPYTARAVAALAFGQRVGAVDVNVRRVVGRIVGGPEGARSMGAARLQAVADELVPADEPGRWTHALMDLGATLCRIRGPRCEECPARPWCAAAAAWASGAPEVDGGLRAGSRATRERPAAFTTTRRWLRGRILDRLREVEGDGWIAFEGPLGEHDAQAVGETLRTLAREGMVELASAAEAGTSTSAGGQPVLRVRLPAR
ncbi:MAG: A/G-specific adenine glycosylase [Chloroflexota bacterium]|nr:A/G-specific adenine glycosylase [Chloroflexota bacterium]